MYPTLSIVRRAEFESPARDTAAYHVVVTSADAPLEIVTTSDGRRIGADAVTALFIGPLPMSALMAGVGTRDASADCAAPDPVSTNCAPLVITLMPPMLDVWSSVVGELLIGRSEVLRHTIAMSASTLLVAQRLRSRVAVCGQSQSPQVVSIRADDGAAPFLDALLSDSLAVDIELLCRRESSRRRALVDRARRALASCPGSPHRLTDLAETLGVSAFHFARVFRAETTLSVHQYLLRLRMARALQRLSCSDVDLSRLALEIGFSSHSHFTATFHKQFGSSPAQVRALLERDRRALGRHLSWPLGGRADSWQDCPAELDRSSQRGCKGRLADRRS